MLGRGVNEMIHRRGHYYVWGDMLPTLRSTHFNIANLETTFTRSEQTVPKVFNFKADPDAAECLCDTNITVVNVANNHILDYSEQGLKDTLVTLNHRGIRHTGAGMNIRQAASAVTFIKNDMQIAILGCTDNEPRWKASEDGYGVNYVNLSNADDRNRILKDISALSTTHDLVVVSIHWGPNLRMFPDAAQIEFAHEMIGHGASVIHGHSAHNFQGIELFKGSPIFYDTGDFIDDYAVHDDLRNDYSFFFIVHFTGKEFAGASLVPVMISNCQVNHASREVYEWSIPRLQKLSAVLGTVVTNEGRIHANV